MKGVKHYTKDGKEWKGKTHKHKDGTLMTGATMTKNSKKSENVLLKFCKKNEFGTVQRVSNVVDLEKSEKMRLLSLS